jgi:carboxymethylenebutenolidase
MCGKGRVPAYFSAPDAAGKFPGLILIEEIWGVNEHIKSVCDRFAAEGFVVLSPELLPEGVLAQLTPELTAGLFDPEKRNEVQPKLREAMGPVFQPEFAGGAVEKLKACVDFLLADSRVNGNIGVLGFCFGGTYSFQLAIHDARVKAAVPFYGQPPEPLDSVASIQCPVLNFNGAHDERIMAKIPALEDAMKKHGKDYMGVVYPDAGHAFFNDTNPYAYKAADAKDAWEKSLAFLKKNVA